MMSIQINNITFSWWLSQCLFPAWHRRHNDQCDYYICSWNSFYNAKEQGSSAVPFFWELSSTTRLQFLFIFTPQNLVYLIPFWGSLSETSVWEDGNVRSVKTAQHKCTNCSPRQQNGLCHKFVFLLILDKISVPRGTRCWVITWQ